MLSGSLSAGLRAQQSSAPSLLSVACGGLWGCSVPMRSLGLLPLLIWLGMGLACAQKVPPPGPAAARRPPTQPDECALHPGR